MKIDVTSNIRQVIGSFDRLSKQVPFATAVALTKTAKVVQAALPAALDADLDRPTEFTKRGTFVQPARKDRLEAVVGFKDKQAAYLSYQVEGGSRAPTKKALRLPTAVDLNAFGNLPAGIIRQLVARAKAGKRATKSQASRFGVSQALGLFYGEPGDGRPAGIYKRTVHGVRHVLVPVIVFPKQPARYRKRFDFYGKTKRLIDRTFTVEFDAAWRNALATAK